MAGHRDSNDIVRNGVIMRRCSRCKEYKPRDQAFSLAGRNRGRLYDGNGHRHRKYRCRICDAIVREEARSKRQPDLTIKQRARRMSAARDAAMRRLTKLTPELFERLYMEELSKAGIDPRSVKLNKPHRHLGALDDEKAG